MSKLDYKHVPVQLLDGAATALAYGNTKYGEGKDRSMRSADDRYNSLMGHLQAWKAGKTADDGSGLSHLYHAAGQLGFLMALDEEVEAEVKPKDTVVMWATLTEGNYETWTSRPWKRGDEWVTDDIGADYKGYNQQDTRLRPPIKPRDEDECLEYKVYIE